MKAEVDGKNEVYHLRWSLRNSVWSELW